VLPRETNVAVDARGFRLWTLVSFDATGPRSYVNPGSWATMGTGFPAAIGAALANPAEPIVSLTGDGGLMMCIHELHTAVDEGIPLTTIALNNSDYAIISEEAGRSYALSEGAYGWDETPIDLVGVAEGMGMDATRAETPEAIREEVESALESDGPTLIEVPTDPREPQASVHMRD
jgi:acetolactate synthase-1/2/3 large subunit